MITDAELKTFCDAVQEMKDAHSAKVYPNLKPDTMSFERGVKNARIVETGSASRCVFCFIDLATGDILKASGWKAPAKGVRGNIRNGAADVGPYGPAYLR